MTKENTYRSRRIKQLLAVINQLKRKNKSMDKRSSVCWRKGWKYRQSCRFSLMKNRSLLDFWWILRRNTMMLWEKIYSSNQSITLKTSNCLHDLITIFFNYDIFSKIIIWSKNYPNHKNSNASKVFSSKVNL